MQDFRSGRPAAEVHDCLVASIREYRRAEKCAVLWFAELRSRRLYRELGFGSMHQYATEALGFSRSRAFQFLRLAEKLENLPRLREAVTTGQVGWTKAAEVVKIATPRTEERWVETASQSSRRVLAAKVEKVKKRAAARVDPAQGELAVGGPSSEPMQDVPVSLTMNMTALQRMRFDSLIEKLRKQGVGGSREEILLAALKSLAGQDVQRQESSRRDSTTPYQVVVYQCDSCKKAQIQDREIPPAQAEAIECDARIQRPGQPNRATIPPSVRREVLARDRHRCQAPGCTHTHFLEVHHIQSRAAGGSNRPENLRTLCSSCHSAAHERKRSSTI